MRARRSGNYGRAMRPRADVDIVAEKLHEDWERGCWWLGVAFVLTFGPMLAWGIYWGWM